MGMFVLGLTLLLQGAILLFGLSFSASDIVLGSGYFVAGILILAKR